MKLGEIQQKWVNSLREHPERQMTGCLGALNSVGTYNACCLGEALCVLARHEGKPLPFTEKNYIADNGDYYYLDSSFKKIGLRNEQGQFRGKINFNGNIIISLSQMNDNGTSWSEIADFIEGNPYEIFTHSI